MLFLFVPILSLKNYTIQKLTLMVFVRINLLDNGGKGRGLYWVKVYKEKIAPFNPHFYFLIKRG
jgi:hypothetical protein